MSAITSLKALLIFDGSIPSATDTEFVPVVELLAAVVLYLPIYVPDIILLNS
jgi:hypothetical protein